MPEKVGNYDIGIIIDGFIVKNFDGIEFKIVVIVDNKKIVAGSL